MNMIPCECEWNCGTLIPEFDSQGRKRRFVKGHYNRGKPSKLKGVPRSDETKQKIRKKHKGKIHSPETRQKISENHADMSGENNPNYGKTPSDATRQLMSDSHIGIQSGKNNPNWQGGISKDPYCFEFTKWLKKEIKERDNHQCKNPDCWKTSSKLMVHHIDYDKKNCSTNNLITICRNCNSKANFNREFWKEFYSKQQIN